MHLVTSTYNSPSAVVYSLACSFRGSEERYLVVCKTDKLEIHALRSHGTELLCEKEIWGAPKGLVQLESSKHLIIALDIPQARIIVLDFDPHSEQIRLHHTSSISPLTHRPSVVQIEPNAPYKVTESDLRVHELTIQTMCFTLPASNNVVAIVYTDHSGHGRLIGRTGDKLDPSPLIPEKELGTVPSLIIPVKIEVASSEPTFGLLLFADKDVTFLNTGIEPEVEEPHQSGKGKGKGKSRSKSEVKAAIQASMVTINVPFEIVTAWTQVDGTHLVVGDSFGQLYLLTMTMEPGFSMTCTPLGQVSVPSTISYLANNILYIGSHSAPSQLVRIPEDVSKSAVEPLGRKHASDDGDDNELIEVVLNHNENIAPILDATLIDADGSGQARIAAVSGDDTGGSLHIIHRGASFRESAVLSDLPHIEGLFALKKYYNTPDHGYVAATTNTGTYLFSVSPSELTYLTSDDLPAITRTAHTLLLENLNLPGLDTAVHVTPNHVSVVDLITGKSISSWNPPKGDITAAAVDVTTNLICAATSQGGLYCLGIQAGGMAKTSECSFSSKAHSQISALAIYRNILVATFWGSNETISMTLPDLQPSNSTPATEPSAVSAISLSNFGESQTYVILARLDGALVVQAISPEGVPLPNARRVIPLGGGPIALASIPAQGNTGARVVAAGKQTVILSVLNRRLNVSSLPITDVCALSAFEAVGMQSSVVYASSTGLTFGQIEQLDKLHVTSHHLGNDSPLCLGHHPQLSSFAIGCMRVATTSDNERYYMRFVDDSTFNDLGNIKLKFLETVSSVLSYTYAGESCFLVGTGKILSGQNEATEGRILDVDGQVSSIQQYKQRIVAAINDRVAVFDVTSGSAMNIEDQIAKWERAYYIQSLVIRGDTIVVGDKLRSVAVLRLVEHFTDDEDDDMEIVERRATSVQLETVAMDMAAIWPCAVEVLNGGTTIIAAQLDGNILTWEVDGNRLEPRAAFYLGETVNKFIVLPQRSTISTRPVALFVTNSGRIGMLYTVNDEDALRLTRLEQQMDKFVKGLGKMRHSEWRAPKLLSASKKPPPRRGVTDGDFIKKFLELDDEHAQKIMSSGSAAEQIGRGDEEQIRRCLEELATN
ncbi:DNA damage-binding protein [Ceratobasidium sp. AG-Ba]|nr:DNA damage-binding protein [Ceratobasidium sp. AG-Ba]